MKKLNEKLNETILKKAMGYSVEESVLEYGMCDDELKLVKKKVSKKYYPPDLSAINLLITNNKSDELQNLSDAELEEEKNKILNLLKELENGN